MEGEEIAAFGVTAASYSGRGLGDCVREHTRHFYWILSYSNVELKQSKYM